jgi:hypothetical protein
MQHGLVFRLDGSGVRQNEHFEGSVIYIYYNLTRRGDTFRDELAIDLGCTMLCLWQNDHAFSHVPPPYPLQSKGGRLARRSSRYGNPFSLNGSYICCCELTKGVWADEYSVTGVNDAALYHARHDRADKRY